MSQPAVRIRDATPADLPALGTLLAETFRFHAAERPDVFVPVADGSLDLTYLDRCFSDPDAHLFVAEGEQADGETEGHGDERAVIGLVQCEVRHTPNRDMLAPRTHVHVEELVVTAAARGRGVGRALMVRAENWARELGITTVELNVFSFNAPARSLYEDLGYRPSAYLLTKQVEPIPPNKPAMPA